MTNRIDEDHQEFHDVYAGKKRKALRKHQKDGSIFRLRADGDKVIVRIRSIDIPFITYGETGEGVNRGDVKKGDVVKKDDDEGRGPKAGQGEVEGIDVAIDLDEVLRFLQNDLNLPDLKPKPNETYEEEEIKYNDISLRGPESLRHNRRTLMQALKRQCADGSIWKLHDIPGKSFPMRLIMPNNSDKRYRQYKIIRKPASNAVIFFARDGSYSMDAKKCEIVSDMAWWIDQWIRRYYKRVERVYIWHDTRAQEVSEEKFYNYRYGGGTTCSSALKLIEKQFDNRFPPNKWNIYIIYFSDGENIRGDNKVFCDVIREKFQPEIVNLVAVTQVLADRYHNSLKHYIEDTIDQDNLRTASISPPEGGNQSYYSLSPDITDDERDKQVRQAIIDILGADRSVVTGGGEAI